MAVSDNKEGKGNMDTEKTEAEAAYRRGWTQSGEETTRLILGLIQLGHTPIEAQRLYAAYQDHVLMPWRNEGDLTEIQPPPDFDIYAMQQIVKRGGYNHITEIERATYMTDSDPEKTEEVLLLTYTPLIHDVALQQITQVLKMTATNIGGEMCMLGDIRIDRENHHIYGRGHKLKEYGEFK
jgi:hypothetical protein